MYDYIQLYWLPLVIQILATTYITLSFKRYTFQLNHVSVSLTTHTFVVPAYLPSLKISSSESDNSSNELLSCKENIDLLYRQLVALKRAFISGSI